MRFHVLAIPHTISMPEYSSCAFTSKVVKLCKMLMRRGHTVIHYGHQDSQVEATQHVTVTGRYDLDKSYKNHDWRKLGWPKYNEKEDWVYQVFYKNAIEALAGHKQPGDFLLCQFGFMHKPVADAHKDLIIVEPGIGYPDGGFAPYRVFESYSIQSAYQGKNAIGWAKNNFWYDTVIPNYFDLDEFDFSPCVKRDYFLFCGRVNSGKGIHIAEQISAATNVPLIVAGAGDFKLKPTTQRVGVVGPVERASLMSGARALLCPSTFMEPFCGVQVEAYLSGVPVISSDWGAFAEYNIHGVTGFRCKTFEQFVWAANHVGELNPQDCRDHGVAFSLERIGPMYEEFFENIARGGWYAENPDRKDLTRTVFRP